MTARPSVLLHPRAWKHAHAIADRCRMPVAKALPNPTLVHHGYAQRASYHVVGPSHEPFADLYLGRLASEKVAHVIADVMGRQVLLMSNDGMGSGPTARALAKHPTRRIGRVENPPRRNPGGRNPRGGEADEGAATELRLFIDNDADLYRQQTTPILQNLWKKMKAGKYDHEKAIKLWGYLAESGAKKYAKEFDDASRWAQIFSPATRRLVAAELADTGRQQLEAREFTWQADPVRFKDLNVGDTFELKNQPYNAIRGPWRKASAKTYVPVDPGHVLAGQAIKVSSATVQVEPLSRSNPKGGSRGVPTRRRTGKHAARGARDARRHSARRAAGGPTGGRRRNRRVARRAVGGAGARRRGRGAALAPLKTSAVGYYYFDDARRSHGPFRTIRERDAHKRAARRRANPKRPNPGGRRYTVEMNANRVLKFVKDMGGSVSEQQLAGLSIGPARTRSGVKHLLATGELAFWQPSSGGFRIYRLVKRNPSRTKTARARRRGRPLSSRQRRSLAKAGFKKSAQTRHLIIGQIRRGMKRGLPHGRRPNPGGRIVGTAAELARVMAELRTTRPHSIAKRFGRNGPTPTQLAAYQAEVRAWNSEYRAVSKAQKAALAAQRAPNPKGRKAACGKIGKAWHDCLHGRTAKCACRNPKPRARRGSVGKRPDGRKYRLRARATRASGARRSRLGRGRRRNPSGRKSAVARAVHQAKRWQDRRDFTPRLERVKRPKPLGTAAAVIGRLHALTYESDKYDGKRKLHEHVFKRPQALVVTDPEGRDLHIVRDRSNYSITPDGIKN